MNCLSCKGCDFGIKYSEFTRYLEHMIDGFSETGVNWLRRLYYLSRRFLSNVERFGLTIYSYLNKIVQYYDKKQLFILRQFYEFQSDYVSKEYNDVHDLCLMYPEFLHSVGSSISNVLSDYTPVDVKTVKSDNAHIAFANKQTHFKNMYLDSLKEKNNQYFIQLKKFYYAKKCNEISETFSSPRKECY